VTGFLLGTNVVSELRKALPEPQLSSSFCVLFHRFSAAFLAISARRGGVIIDTLS
jgi:hypothetical protein